jgi:hypothetical protein
MNDCCHIEENRMLLGRIQNTHSGIGGSYIVLEYKCQECNTMFDDFYSHTDTDVIKER